MSSDRRRWLRLLILLVLLGALCSRYAWLAVHAPIGWRLCLSDPPAHDGRSLLLPLYTVAAIDGPVRYTLSKEIKDIPVEGPTDGLYLGQTISVRATFRAADRVAVETDRDLHRLREAKMALGILGLLLALLAAPRAFAWRPAAGLVERERPSEPRDG